MKRRYVFTSIVALSILFSWALPNRAAPAGNGITVNNADATLFLDNTFTQELFDSAVDIGSKVSVEFANDVQVFDLSSVSATFSNLLGQVGPHVAFEFANASLPQRLTPVSQSFQAELEKVINRVRVEFSNDVQRYTLGGNYPAGLIDDSAPPEIVEEPETTPISDDSVEIEWTTDEFVTITIRIGSQSGNYSEVIVVEIYAKTHLVTISNLEVGETYYYEISGADLSGNSFRSGERSFTMGTPEQKVFLPFVIR